MNRSWNSSTKYWWRRVRYHHWQKYNKRADIYSPLPVFRLRVNNSKKMMTLITLMTMISMRKIMRIMRRILNQQSVLIKIVTFTNQLFKHLHSPLKHCKNQRYLHLKTKILSWLIAKNNMIKTIKKKKGKPTGILILIKMLILTLSDHPTTNFAIFQTSKHPILF